MAGVSDETNQQEGEIKLRAAIHWSVLYSVVANFAMYMSARSYIAIQCSSFLTNVKTVRLPGFDEKKYVES
jgi:hypothetical protein